MQVGDSGPGRGGSRIRRDSEREAELRQRLARWAEPDVRNADLALFAAEGRASEAAAGRVRERWLRQQAVESASLAGLLLDAAEAGTAVECRLSSGRSLRGVVTALGRDFCVIDVARQQSVYVSTGVIAQLRTDERIDPTGDRTRNFEVALDQVIRGLASERTRVSLIVAGSTDPITGELRSCGVDLCTILLDGSVGSLVGRGHSDITMRAAHVRLNAIDEVLVIDP